MQISRIDVVVLTKDSEKLLTKCLTSIYDNLPIQTLIVVDGYSNDRTLEIIDDFQKKYENVILIQDNGTRATARQKGLKRVATDWFMFVDSDVVLCDDWFEKAEKHMNEDVGAIWGIEVWSTIRNPLVLKLFLWITMKIFIIRGGTHDILIYHEAVKDILIPSKLHVFEDAYIKKWIEKKGLRVIGYYNPFCIHYRPENVWTLKGSLVLIAEAFRFGSLKMVWRLLFAYGFYMAYSIYQLVLRNKPSIVIEKSRN